MEFIPFLEYKTNCVSTQLHRAELLQHPQHIDLRPPLDDLSVLKPVDRNTRPLHGLACRRHTHEHPAVYAAARTHTEINPPALAALRQDPDPRVRAALVTVAQAPPVLGPAAGDESLPGGQEHFERLLACGLSFSNLAMVDKILFLDAVPLFAGLEPEDLHELSDLARERVFTLSEILVKQNDLTDDLFVVMLGQAVVTVERQGQPQEMWRAGAGDVVGEMSAIDGEPQSATARSASDRLYALQIRGDDFRRLLSRRPDLAARLMKTIALRLRQTLASS